MSAPVSSPSGPSRARMWRAVVTLIILLGSGLLAWNYSPKLGLDLSGGSYFVLEAQHPDGSAATSEDTDRTIEILRGRIDSLGVAEPNIFRVGDDRIRVELPGVQDRDEAEEVIGRTAQLHFHLVEAENQPGPQVDGEGSPVDEEGNPIDLIAGEAGTLPVVGDGPGGTEVITEYVRVGSSMVTGEGVSDSSFGMPEGTVGWAVTVEFNGQGRDGWRQLVNDACTSTGGGQRIAIALDNTVISAPTVQQSLCVSGGGNSTQITGGGTGFNIEEARSLSILIKGGALPLEISPIDDGTIGPTLGAAAIDASTNAAIVGLLITAVFITLVYRIVGFLAAIALSTYALISFAVLVWIGATLTLPGLAGFVLAIGLAIDANVLVYERAREEYVSRKGEGLTRALSTGFNKAWSAIIDANVTTIIAAVLLFYFATGPVRGFGVTLIIGTLASMISALVIARTFTEFFVARAFANKHQGSTGLATAGPIRRWLETTDIDLTKRAGTWVVVTLLIAFISLSGIFFRGLNLGVEFTGGQQLDFAISEDVDVEDIRVAVGEAGFPTAIVQETSADAADDDTTAGFQDYYITVRAEALDAEQKEVIREAIAAEAGEAVLQHDRRVEASFGIELRNKALIAFAIAIAAQMAYLAWRFRWTYAFSVQASMASVVLMVVGFFAWTGRPIDSVFLAAILSIIGLAINDTIVVFDRIREETRDLAGRTFRVVVNKAVLLTLPRTVNTGLGAMFILGALAVFGGDTLNNFAIALMLGLGVGVLSTIFTASAIAVLLEERWPYDAEKEKAKATSIDPYASIEAGGRDLPDPPELGR